MLAQNFMSHETLGIAQDEWAALIKVLGMLERGDLSHNVNGWLIGRLIGPNEFNMAATLKRDDCGTIACIGGWAHILSDGTAFPQFADPFPGELDLEGMWTYELRDLFGFGHCGGLLQDRTTEQAAIALRSYLTNGEARWNEALAA